MPAKKTTKKKWETYDDYLKSPEWSQLKKEALEKADETCERCFAIDGEKHVHHWKYPASLEKDNVENLVVLCKECHEELHANKIAKNRAAYLNLIQRKNVAGEELDIAGERGRKTGIEELVEAFRLIKNSSFSPIIIYTRHEHGAYQINEIESISNLLKYFVVRRA